MANQNYSSFVPIVGTILRISPQEGCCSQMMSVATENSLVNFVVDASTQIVDARQLRQGLQVAAFYDSSLPVPLIYPPQYRAQIVTLIGRNEQVMIGEFGPDLVASDRSLRLNVARGTEIQTLNGQNFNCSLSNRTLLVYYSVTTRSIPPQTTPRRIVVLC